MQALVNESPLISPQTLNAQLFLVFGEKTSTCYEKQKQPFMCFNHKPAGYLIVTL